MGTHLTTDPAATGTAVLPCRPEWLALSAALGEEVPVIADRDDLVVTIAPGAGGGAPACFYPARALIEVDGNHLKVDPTTIQPEVISDRARYAATWGALTHECGHARHTAWQPPPGTPPGIVAAALLLEEPRMEAAQVARRPDDRHWLRACARDIVATDLHLFTDPAHAPKLTRTDAAHTAALLLGRADAGILTHTEVAPVARVVEDVLGSDTLDQLRALWRTALGTADHDGEAMLELGRQWCEIVGTDPHNLPPIPGSSPDATGEPGESGAPSESGVPSPLAGAIEAVLADVAANVARETAPEDPATCAAAAQADEKVARETAKRTSRGVFTSAGTRTGKTALAGTRPPTPEERTAARVLGRALNTAGVRDQVAVKTSSVMPPGRLRMRGALAADAQRAAGAVPTAEPFTRTTRTPVPCPPLRLGVACDVSGSMSWARAHVASAAWILAHAAHHTRVPAQTASVIFGNHVRPLTHPGSTPGQVTEFVCDDNWEDIPTALDALDGALGLSAPGAARLLVIVSDGEYRDRPRSEGQHRLNRLRATGCGVLWLVTHHADTPLDGATVHHLTDPAATARTIGRAATTALRTTH
jgi:hypothetical protein